MGSEWQKYALTDLYSVSSGLSKPAKDFGEGSPFVSFKDVFYNFFLPDDLSQLVRSTDKEKEKCSVRRGDVFLTRTSETMEDLGMSCVARKDYPEATFNGFCKRLRPSTELPIHPEYVGYFLRTPQFRNEMLAFSTMSTRASLNNEMIGRLNISLPPLPEQKAIAHILGTLDDKIELNRRTNATLEGMAQALFKSWFVDFDPVIDNALAAGNPIPDELAARAEVRRQALANGTANRDAAEAFPDSFQETEELGWVPEGWEAGTIGTIAKAIGGFAFKSNAFKERGFPVIKIKNIVGNGTVLIEGAQCIDLEDSNKALKFALEDGDLLMAMTGATVGKTGLVVNEIRNAYLNQRVAKLVGRNHENLSPFLFCFFREQKNFDTIVSTAEGSAQPNISSSGIESVECPIPSEDALILFVDSVNSNFEKWISNHKQSKTLTKLRDTLLPKLISGELLTQAHFNIDE
jgi:type I restriction enzyme S subunit